ncbi:shikimate dehydrogenase family protein [Peptostreptococcus equinus]|uniref:Shikimate dehydrogenase n=1 Tax=Peptostreptococcus equinus TaxID=3003601 RepID=A0ABY7JSD7_9FIRM|nr:shikimate dehydrogenase [Peptostreptococcus sp. CBA3647]WAW15406.1 shikimate dehydrogenase [Peptostreptococcus sp. CBA3647]
MEFGLLGKSISYSFSPILHEILGSKPYELIELEEDKIEDFFKKKDFKGINVTIPYKKIAMEYCDFVDPAAARIGNVNTILNKSGKLYGYNTDYYGFTYTINKLGIDVRNTKPLIVGGGATYNTVRVALEDLGVSNILNVSRKGINKLDDFDYYKEADFLINCTPIGNNLHLDIEFPIDIRKLNKIKYLVDLNYNPLEIKLVCQAKKLGAKASTGLLMLVAQAVKSSEIFQGKRLEEEKIDEVLMEMRKIICK